MIYSWGLNLLGQLGHGDNELRWRPTLLQSLKEKRIVQLATGAGHSLCLDTENTLYSWGASADF